MAVREACRAGGDARVDHLFLCPAGAGDEEGRGMWGIAFHGLACCFPWGARRRGTAPTRGNIPVSCGCEERSGRCRAWSRGATEPLHPELLYTHDPILPATLSKQLLINAQNADNRSASICLWSYKQRIRVGFSDGYPDSLMPKNFSKLSANDTTFNTHSSEMRARIFALVSACFTLVESSSITI